MEPPTPAASPTTAACDTQSALDHFIIGLVPTFKRERAEVHRAKLKEVDRIDNLHAMAKAQQVFLCKEIRPGEVKIENLRMAVLAVV